MAAVLGSYQHAVAFRSDRFTPVVLAENKRVKVILACLHVVTPPPTEADHAGVVAGLQRRRWREPE